RCSSTSSTRPSVCSSNVVGNPNANLVAKNNVDPLVALDVRHLDERQRRHRRYGAMHGKRRRLTSPTLPGRGIWITSTAGGAFESVTGPMSKRTCPLQTGLQQLGTQGSFLDTGVPSTDAGFLFRLRFYGLPNHGVERPMQGAAPKPRFVAEPSQEL